VKYFFLVKIHSSIHIINFLLAAYVHLSKHILDYQQKQTGTLRISENVTFTNDDVMNYVIGPSRKNFPGPLPFNPALVISTAFEES